MIIWPGNADTINRRFIVFMLKSGLSECSFQHKIKNDVAALHSGANRFACRGGY